MAKHQTTAATREEEIKNTLRDQYFNAYDATPILGDIDFAVTTRRSNPAQLECFEREWFLWAEAKAGTTHSVTDSFVQLIITIGRAHTHEKHMPPIYLGAFDEAKIAFIEFHHVVSVFYQNDFNWNVTPSNHNTKEFQQLKTLLESTLQEHIVRFDLTKDGHDLRKFIKQNFREGGQTQGVQISRNNYLFVFQRWVEEVKPTINVDWGDIPATRVCDFFFADLISHGDYTLRTNLAVVLRGDEYEIIEQTLQSGRVLFSKGTFTDGMKAYRAFWNKYKRPPRQEAIDIILERRDLLIPHNLRQYHGAFFTPPQWVELSQRYLAYELGDDWQQQYYVWDCCAGTGNLLYGLGEPYRVWASTLDQADVQVMKTRAKEGELNLIEKHIFQFDFINGSFEHLPDSLRAVIDDPQKRQRLVIYINPPYAEATSGQGRGFKNNVATASSIYNQCKTTIGKAAQELFAQVFYHVFTNMRGCLLAEFSTLKILQAGNFKMFRTAMNAQLRSMFVVPANTFDNVNGDFPIGFMLWDTGQQGVFKQAVADVYNRSGELVQRKTFAACDDIPRINDWLKGYKSAENRGG